MCSGGHDIGKRKALNPKSINIAVFKYQLDIKNMSGIL